MSSFRNRINTMSASRLEVTSCRRRSLSSASISSTMRSISSSVTRCLAHAFVSPARNFSRSKDSLPPSRFITTSLRGSRRSYVVNLFSQDRHSRRRRTASLFSESRESMTLVSSKSQYGHCTSQPPCTKHHIWYCENLAHYIFGTQYPLNNS